MRNEKIEKTRQPKIHCRYGTTICACQKLKRRCLAIEIEPAYVAIAIERLAEMGVKPKLAP